MKKKLLITLSLFVILLLPLAAKAYKIGDEDINIPAPEGFYEVTPEHGEISNFFDSLSPKGTKRIASFVSKEDIALIMMNGSPELNRYFQVMIENSRETDYLSPEDFAQLKVQEKEVNKSLSDEDIKNLLEDNVSNIITSISNMSGADVGIKGVESVSLGVQEDGENYIIFPKLTKYEISSPPPQESIRFLRVGARAVILMKGKVIHIMTTASYQSKEDLEWTQQIMKSWIQNINKNNDNISKKSTVSKTDGTISYYVVELLIAIYAIIYFIKQKKTKDT